MKFIIGLIIIIFLIFGISFLNNFLSTRLEPSSILFGKNSVVEINAVFDKHNKSKNIYYGKVTIRNLSQNKILKLRGFNIINNNKSYSVKIDSIATIHIQPLERVKKSIISNDLPLDANFNQFTIDLDFSQNQY